MTASRYGFAAPEGLESTREAGRSSECLSHSETAADNGCDGAAQPYDGAQACVVSEDREAARPDGRFQPGNQAAKRKQLRLVRLDTVSKVKRTLWQVVAELRKGVLRADVGNATTNALRLLLQLYETEEQDGRVAELEAEVRRMQHAVRQQIATLHREPALRAGHTSPFGGPGVAR